MSNTSDADMS